MNIYRYIVNQLDISIHYTKDVTLGGRALLIWKQVVDTYYPTKSWVVSIRQMINGDTIYVPLVNMVKLVSPSEYTFDEPVAAKMINKVLTRHYSLLTHNLPKTRFTLLSRPSVWHPTAILHPIPTSYKFRPRYWYIRFNKCDTSMFFWLEILHQAEGAQG